MNKKKREKFDKKLHELRKENYRLHCRLKGRLIPMSEELIKEFEDLERLKYEKIFY